MLASRWTLLRPLTPRVKLTWEPRRLIRCHLSTWSNGRYWLEPADAGTPSGQNDVGGSVADIGSPEDTYEPPKDVMQPPDAQMKPGDVTSGKDSFGTTEPDVVSESDTGPGWSISDAMPWKPDSVPQENEQSCSADCAGKICGSDGCGGSCGSCSGFNVCTDFGAACATPEGEQSYRVGVDYHATGADFGTAFLSRYHEPGVRDDVLAQLQGMANDGVKIISTRIWLTNAPVCRLPRNRIVGNFRRRTSK